MIIKRNKKKRNKKLNFYSPSKIHQKEKTRIKNSIFTAHQTAERHTHKKKEKKKKKRERNKTYMIKNKRSCLTKIFGIKKKCLVLMRIMQITQ